MKPISLQDVRQAVMGKSLNALSPTAPKADAVCTDSRRMAKNSIFIALRGDNFDGHRYLHDAAAGGAAAAIVEELPPGAPDRLVYFQVPDTRVAMGKLAKRVRQDLKGKVVAVAGSNGKTSTKHLVRAALSGDPNDKRAVLRLRGTISPKSYNNDVGVPLTIFAAGHADDYCVLEMGTNRPGEIQPLSEMARPDIAVITNCGAEHLEGLGDLAGVRRENAAILSGLNPAGMLVVNGDDPELLKAVDPWRGQRLTFGFDKANDLFAADVRADETGVRFHLNGRKQVEVFVPLLGRHTALNALAAMAVARKCGVFEEQVVHHLSTATGPEMRLQLQQVNGVTLLNDAYNANPNSMRAALETVASLPKPGRRIAVLGEMRELGETSATLHREIGEFAATCGLDLLVCVGEGASAIADGARAGGLSAGSVEMYADSPTAAKHLKGAFRDGDVVLLKASRGVKLEEVAAAIE
jgi:UDP-N-acetylmuramoyl-tripeptide--D-alanyl-D-alanine ligase